MALTRLGPINNIINGTLGVANGGTGLASGTTGQFLKFTGSTVIGTGEAGGGKVNQVVFSQSADASYIGTNSASYVTTGTSVTITPSATNSKIQLNVYTGRSYTGGAAAATEINIYRSTSSSYLGTGDSMATLKSSANVTHGSHNIQFIDNSHNTTSAITYTPYFKSSSSHGYFAHEDSVWQIQATEILA